jgi:TRAP-type mannitol/chloroaromatic compound transport system permease large subunit
MATTPPHDQLAPAEGATTSAARGERGAGDTSLKNRLATTRQHVDRRILSQVRILTIIALAMLGILVVDVAQGTLGVAWAAAGLLAGAALGVIASRIRRLEWDDQTSQVIARLDAIGAVILVGYIAAMLARDWVLGHWVEGPALAALGLSVTAGALAGQVLGTRRGVRKVLEALGLRAPADLAAVQALPSAPDRPTREGAGSTGDGK